MSKRSKNARHSRRAREENGPARQMFVVHNEPVRQRVSLPDSPVLFSTSRIVGYKPTHIVALSPMTLEAHHVVSANAFPRGTFPERCGILAIECANQLSLMCHATLLVRRETGRDPGQFLETLQRNAHVVDLAPLPEPLPIFYENFAYLSALMSALVAMKAGLDQLAKLIKAATGHPAGANEAFHKGKVEDTELAGGRFIKWLRKSPQAFKGSEELANLLLASSKEWLTVAVGYRDALVHHGGIDSAQGSSVLHDRPIREIRLQDVRPPTMPHGEPVADYCELVKTRTLELVAAAVEKVPGAVPANGHQPSG